MISKVVDLLCLKSLKNQDKMVIIQPQIRRTIMEKIVERGMLYDFYGELLTEHQKAIYEEAVFNDMSLSEIAEQYEISRQGVHDLLKRCDKILNDYENKLHLVEKFMKIKSSAGEIHKVLDEMDALEDIEQMKVKSGEIRKISNEILEEL